ncbi:contact-dependent growth inhibition system immunity protein [Lachnospiraceae bacterium 64-25]
MEDNRKIKEIYNCKAIVSSEELYPLQKWYNRLIDKKIDEITVADILRMIRQKEFMNLAMSKAINFLQENVFVGESYEGELFEKISEMDSSFLISYADDLKEIIKSALVKSEIHDWSYEGEEEEFKDLIDSLSKKVK